MQQSTESLLQQARTSEVEKKMLLRKISQMNNLPTPSGNVMKVMLLLRDEDVKVSQLVPAIEKDQSLVAQILKLINSGYYGLRKTIETVDRAVALLGIINIKHVVYSASIMEFFSDEEQLEWNHSYSTSVLMSNLIKDNELPDVGNLPMAMIMHDLGKVVLRRFSPKKYKVALMHASTDNIPVYRIEDAMLQINHSEVGAMLLEKWDSAEEIVKPVSYHHCEDVPKDFVFETALVQFVNWVDCSVRGIRCFEPTRELMNAAGIEEIDRDYWLHYQEELIAALEGGRPPQTMKTSGKLQRKTGAVPAANAQQAPSSHPGKPAQQAKASPPAPTSPIKRPEEPKPQPQAQAPEAPVKQEIKVFQQPSMSSKEAEVLKHSYKAPAPPVAARPNPAPPVSQASAPSREDSEDASTQGKSTQVIKRPEKPSSPPAEPSPPAGMPQASAPPVQAASVPESQEDDTSSTQKISRQSLHKASGGDSNMPVKTQKIEPSVKRSILEEEHLAKEAASSTGTARQPMAPPPARPAPPQASVRSPLPAMRPSSPPPPPPEPPADGGQEVTFMPEETSPISGLGEETPGEASGGGDDSSTQVIRRPGRPR